MVKTDSVDTSVPVTNVLIAAADFSIVQSFIPTLQRWWNADCQTAYKNQRKLWGILISYYGESLGIQKGKSKNTSVQSWDMCVNGKDTNGIYREFSFPILQTSSNIL
ncbi:RNase H domain-containing protein [Trichonephila clavipes]|nr:RNase H domain-containing protein [Trichonephila clavipes]